MQNLIFIAGLASVLGLLYLWAFRHLPHERWQIFGVIPIRKDRQGQWQGLNLTYYGLINACAVTFALAMTFILMASTGMSMTVILTTVCGILVIIAPSAKWVARIVEKKSNTFTIGGAAFCGLVGSPLLILAIQPLVVRWASIQLPLMPIITAMAIGYTFGEGSGRLACLSFGCCYGKPMDALPPVLRRLASPFGIVFHGQTKKAAYAGGLEGHTVLGIQAITAVLYTITGLTAVYLYLNGHFTSAYLSCILVTQIWRVFSEFMRADYRGGGSISAYQYMAGIVVCASVIYSIFLSAASQQTDLMTGLGVLWHPLVIVICQLAWLTIFLFTGRSQITAAHVSLFVRSDEI